MQVAHAGKCWCAVFVCWQMKITYLCSCRMCTDILIYYWHKCIGLLTTGCPLLTVIPSWSIMLREMVMEGRSRLWGGNCGINGPLCGPGGSGIGGNGESTSDKPRPDSVSGGGVMGGISNSSSPRLGVWNVWKGRKETKVMLLEYNLKWFPSITLMGHKKYIVLRSSAEKIDPVAVMQLKRH